MPKEHSRGAQVATQMQKELSYVLQRQTDANLGLVTVNEVVVSRDLAIAKVYITAINSPNTNSENIDKLSEIAPQIRHLIAKRMRLRHIPQLRFFYDNSYENGIKIAKLLQKETDRY